MASVNRDVCLVKRRNYQDEEDWIGRDHVLACYANLDDANRYAKSETDRIYQDALSSGPAKPPTEKEGVTYSAHIEVNDEWVSLYAVRVYVVIIECQSSYQEEPSSLQKEKYEEEYPIDTDVKLDPNLERVDGLSGPSVETEHESSSSKQYPFPLPRGTPGTPGCLSGLKFCMVGEQEPYSESTVKTVIEQYGGILLGINKLRGGSVPKPVVATILGKLAEGDVLLETIRAKEWIDPVFDQKKLFIMVETLSGVSPSWPKNPQEKKVAVPDDGGRVKKRKRGSVDEQRVTRGSVR